MSAAQHPGPMAADLEDAASDGTKGVAGRGPTLPHTLAASVIRSLACGVVVTDTEGCIVEWNDTLQQLTGKQRADVLHTKFSDLVPDAVRAGIERKLKTVVTLGHPAFFSHEVYDHVLAVEVDRVVGTDASWMKQDATLSPLRDEDGTIRGVCVTIIDVTSTFVVKQELERLNTQLKHDVGRDALTGAFNRGCLMSQLKRTTAASKRHEQQACVLLLDVDHFKQLNDTEGHLAGDAGLIQLSACLAASVREEDVVARYGGEEFCVLLPNTETDGALKLAERLRAAVEDMKVSFEDRTLRITVSIGVSPLLLDDDGVDRSLKAADAGLYKAKRAGRNQVCFVSEVEAMAAPAS